MPGAMSQLMKPPHRLTLASPYRTQIGKPVSRPDNGEPVPRPEAGEPAARLEGGGGGP
jgi:hypothetical protein